MNNGQIIPKDLVQACVQTFRDPDGMWQKFSLQELASMDGFLRNPQRVWEWYQHRRRVITSVHPNAGHVAIAKMQDMFPNFTLITQNVDRLHQRAGSRLVIELHGNIEENFCVDCHAPFTGEIDLTASAIPCCEECGGLIRPAVVWFGEMLPERALEAAEHAASNCDVFFSIGTSAEVYPAAALPSIAKQRGAILVEINTAPTALTRAADFVLRGKSGEILPAVLASLG